MAARKTLKVAEVLQDANTFFEASSDDAIKERQGVAYFIEHLLHMTGNYKGFKYLNVNFDVDGEGTVHIPDETRRQYYYATNLTEKKG